MNITVEGLLSLLLSGLFLPLIWFLIKGSAATVERRFKGLEDHFRDIDARFEKLERANEERFERLKATIQTKTKEIEDLIRQGIPVLQTQMVSIKEQLAEARADLQSKGTEIAGLKT